VRGKEWMETIPDAFGEEEEVDGSAEDGKDIISWGVDSTLASVPDSWACWVAVVVVASVGVAALRFQGTETSDQSQPAMVVRQRRLWSRKQDPCLRVEWRWSESKEGGIGRNVPKV
jgi:hypothetical protein